MGLRVAGDLAERMRGDGEGLGESFRAHLGRVLGEDLGRAEGDGVHEHVDSVLLQPREEIRELLFIEHVAPRPLDTRKLLEEKPYAAEEPLLVADGDPGAVLEEGLGDAPCDARAVGHAQNDDGLPLQSEPGIA